MHKKAKRAFTLIEVMVAVMIISVVILALLEMFANNTHIFSALKKQKGIHSYASFLIANSDYGLETQTIGINNLVNDFKIDDDLLRELESKNITIIYQKVEKIDLSKYEDSGKEKIKGKEIEEKETEKVNTNVVFEIGKTIMQLNDTSLALLRLRVEP